MSRGTGVRAFRSARFRVPLAESPERFIGASSHVAGVMIVLRIAFSAPTTVGPAFTGRRWEAAPELRPADNRKRRESTVDPEPAGIPCLSSAVALAVWIAVVCYSPALASTPSTTSTQEPPTPARIRDLLDDGRFADAESLARVLLSECESTHTVDSIEVAEALDLLVEARWRSEDADEEALKLARRAVAIKERLLPSEDARLARSLSNLGRVLILRGEYEAARPICERGLSVAEKRLGPDHQDVAESLSALGDLLYATGDHSGSGHLYERALAILEKELGPDHPKVARALWDWSASLWARADYEGAKGALERVLAIQQKALRADHPAMADTLNMMGNVLSYSGEGDPATRLYERAAAIAEPAFGPESSRLATILYNLAERRIMFEEDYTEGRKLLERILGIEKKVFGLESFQFAYSQRLLAEILMRTGDYTEAERIMKRALDVLERVLGPEHEVVATSLMKLGELHILEGDYPEAAFYLRRALPIWEKVRGADNFAVGDVSILLGQCEHAAGKYTEAETLYRKALQIYEKQAPEGDAVGWALINIADSLRDSGKPAQATPIYERAVVIREHALGRENPAAAWTVAHFAESLVRGGETRRGFALALRAEEIGRNHLRLTVRALPERPALRYAAVRQSGLDLALSVAVQGRDRASAGQVWDALIRSRALITDEVAARLRAVRETDRPETRTKYADLAAARQRLANLTIRGAAQDTQEHFRAVLEGARKEKERAEQALAEKSLAFRGERARERAGLAEIRSTLPPGSALVAFARYLEHAIPKGQKVKNARAPEKKAIATWVEERVTPCYAAFVIRAGEGEPHLVRLGTASEIDSLVSSWRKEISRGDSGRPPKELEADCRAAGVALRRRIWDPLAVHLGHPERIFVVLDGTLHLVNLATFPMDQGEYLVETGPLIQHLSAERDLVPGEAEERKGEGILALGGPAFDDRRLFTASAAEGVEAPKGEPVNVASLPSYRGKRSTCGDFQSMRFEPLPDSEREVNEVVALWKKGGGDSSHAEAREGAALRLIGARASETAFKEQAPGHQVIHLATHGFFLGGRCASALDATRASTRPVAGGDPTTPPPVVGENPLLLSGLALAGANNRASAGPDEDDGILTAEEVAAMDLSGVDWVVLSACDTGAGEYMPGEGVFGLRRAFQVAGARTVITSLWSVEDEATRAWMRNLYQERLGGASTAEAVRNASLKMIESLKRTGLPAHPYFWGAFVAVGD